MLYLMYALFNVCFISYMLYFINALFQSTVVTTFNAYSHAGMLSSSQGAPVKRAVRLLVEKKVIDFHC